MKSENTKSPWCLKGICECWALSVWLFQCDLIIWIEHSELELNIISNKWDPLITFLHIDINVIFDVNLSFVVLWIVVLIRSITLLIVSYVVISQDSSFLKVPLNHFCAQNEIW